MKLQNQKIVIGVFALCIGLVSSVYAADQTAPAAPKKTIQPMPMTSTAAPSTNTAEGSIVAVDIKSASPNIKLVSASGAQSIPVDLKLTKVWHGSKIEKLADLKAGEHVKVRETMKDGKMLAKSIDIVA